MKLKQTFFNSPKVYLEDKAKYEKEKHSIIDNINENKFGFLQELNKPRLNEVYNSVDHLKKFDNVLFLLIISMSLFSTAADTVSRYDFVPMPKLLVV